MFEGYRESGKEKPNVTAQTLARESFRELLYQGGSFLKDRRFSREGAFKYFCPEEDLNGVLALMGRTEDFYSVVKEADMIVGLSKLQKDSHDEETIVISFLSIDPEYEGRGYASALAREIFRFAKERNFTIKSSRYSEKGLEKLQPIFRRLASEFGVRFVDAGLGS